jgi:hypothetical protein
MWGAVFIATCLNATAQEQQNCTEVHAMVRMVRAQSVAALERSKAAAGEGYRARVAYAFRRFELMPEDRAAATAVLDLIPKRLEQGGELLYLSGPLCDEESVAEMKTLGRLDDRLARDWANAAILIPERMADYVSYPIIMGLNPHDDYAVQMRRVCRAHHDELAAAVRKLPEHDREWFLKQVFNPKGCRTLGFPEAD